MKNIVAAIVLSLAVVSVCSADTREVQYNTEGQTAFGNVAATGLNQTGNPAYISLLSPNQLGVNYTYYLWVNGVGNVCIASYPTISGYTSFPTGNWNGTVPGMGCTKVGSQ